MLEMSAALSQGQIAFTICEYILLVLLERRLPASPGCKRFNVPAVNHGILIAEL
jgi:hypothetical protein